MSAISKSDPIATLSFDAISELFSYLDINTLARCSRVSKRWQETLQDDYLWKRAFQRFWDTTFSFSPYSIMDVRKSFAKCCTFSKEDLTSRIEKFIDKMPPNSGGVFTCFFPVQSRYRIFAKFLYGYETETPVNKFCIFLGPLFKEGEEFEEFSSSSTGYGSDEDLTEFSELEVDDNFIYDDSEFSWETTKTSEPEFIEENSIRNSIEGSCSIPSIIKSNKKSAIRCYDTPTYPGLASLNCKCFYVQTDNIINSTVYTKNSETGEFLPAQPILMLYTEGTVRRAVDYLFSKIEKEFPAL